MDEIVQDLVAAYGELKRTESLLGAGRATERLAAAGKAADGRALLVALSAAERAVAFARQQVEAARAEAFELAARPLQGR